MKKYKYNLNDLEEEIELEDAAFFLIIAIDKLTSEILKLRTSL